MGSSQSVGPATATFYEAFGIEPGCEVVNLQSSTDRDKRITAALGFSQDPER